VLAGGVPSRYGVARIRGRSVGGKLLVSLHLQEYMEVSCFPLSTRFVVVPGLHDCGRERRQV
jgi:hypothetical protein